MKISQIDLIIHKIKIWVDIEKLENSLNSLDEKVKSQENKYVEHFVHKSLFFIWRSERWEEMGPTNKF